MKLNVIPPTALAVLAFSCGGGGGGGEGGGNSAPPATAPTALSYAADDVIYLRGVRVLDNAPQVDGSQASYSSNPDLPAGLGFGADGSIIGVPTALADRTTYTITASNSAGSVSAALDIAVEPPARFAYAANQVDNTISVYTVDGETGQLLPKGFVGTELTQVAPQKILAHPNGRFVYAANLGNIPAVGPNISAYTVDAATGQLIPGSPAGTGEGPFDMAFSPDVAFAYVAAETSNFIWEYSINPSSGLLSLIRAPISDGTQPTAIRFHPSGNFAYVVYAGTNRVALYDVNTATGELTLRNLMNLGAMVRHIEIDATGDRLYATDAAFNLLIQFDVDQVTGELSPALTRALGGTALDLRLHPTGRWALVSRTNGSVRAWSIDPEDGNLTIATGSIAVGSDPVEISFDRGGRFAYVTNEGSNDVSILEVDLGTGELTPNGTSRTRATPGSLTTAIGDDPAQPQGRFLYTADTGPGPGTLTPYQVNSSTGQLSAIAVPPILTGNAPRAVAADPFGRFLYVVNQADRSISTFEVDPVTGAPTPVGLPLVFDANGMPRDIAVDGSGRFAFASNAGGAVEALWIDQGTGELTFLATTPSLGDMPEAIAVDPTSQFIYVSNVDSNNIGVFRFDQGRLAGGQGDLFIVSSSTTAVAGDVTDFSFSPSGDRLYATIPGLEDQVQPFDINPSSGALTLVDAGSPEGNDPVASDFHPTGLWAYAALQGGSGSVAEYDVIDGDLVLRTELFVGLGPVDLIVDPSGGFLYVVNGTGGDVSVFGIDENGALSSTGAAITGAMPQAIELISGL